MAQQEVTTDGVLVVPGAYARTVVETTPAGLAVNGVLALIGESDAGPSYAEEEKLSQNLYSVDQLGDLEAKYGAGSLVDAARIGAAPSNDPNIVGGPSRFLIVKTNTGVKAAGTLPAIGGGTYAALTAKLAGKAGNLVTRTVVARTAEVVPTTGAVVLAPPQQSTDVAFRVNGGAVATATLAAAALPSSMVSTINALTGVAASGGTNRSLITAVAGTITMTQDSGFQCHLVISTAWANTPSIGDIVYIPTLSPLAAANEGTYVVTAATSARLDLYKLLDAAGSGAIRTAPATEAAASVAATTDVQAFAPVVISQEAGAVVPGKGKTLEIAESGAENFNDVAFVFAGATASPPASNATFVSTALSPKTVVSATEYTVEMDNARASTGTTEALATTVGGAVGLTLGYRGTTASAVIANGVLTITVVGGPGSSPAAITLADYATIGDLVTYLNTLTGFAAAAGNTALSQKAARDLDPGTYTIATEHGAANGRIKLDGKVFLDEVNTTSQLVTVAPVAPATQLIGLPDVATLAFLAGGSRGATTNTSVQGAFTALQATRCNFVVPLFSRDATADIADGLTDAASSYTISAVNAQLRSHVLLMSQFKRRRRRQGFASVRTTYAAAKAAAGELASSRVALFFQDMRDLGADGNLKQYQPWGLAVKAAALQAAGFYRAIVAKFFTASGVLQAAGDFDDELEGDVEDALVSGLCPAVTDEGGGVKFSSDQTTYTRDSNFVFNSIQAVYAADIIAATAELKMERSFVGQSVADVNKALAVTTLDAVMTDLRRLKLIAPDDAAPKGYTGVKVVIDGPALRFSVTVKLAGALYFCVVDFKVTPVQQSA